MKTTPITYFVKRIQLDCKCIFLLQFLNICQLYLSCLFRTIQLLLLPLIIIIYKYTCLHTLFTFEP